jgi:hypothetical protein
MTNRSDNRRYLGIFCGLSGAVLLAVSGMNYVVDPYLTHQWDTPRLQRLRPIREKLGAWGKTYAVARFQPAVVYIGNSRTELGLPTQMPQFAGKPVFNSALSGASIGDAIRLAQHASQVSRVETMVWGIDAPSFSMEDGNTDLDPDLTADGRYFFLRRGLLDLKRALALDMTRDSLSVLTGSYGAVCRSSLAFHGQRDDACISLRIGGWRGTQAAVLPRTREYIRGAGPTAEAQAAFDASVDALCRRAIRVRLYINPTHAMMQDALYWAGKWAAVEAWQRALTAAAARQRRAGCDVQLYDFSDFNSITTEAIPQAGQPAYMVNYWETSHYRVNVGRMILTRMFGGAEALPPDFGVALLPSTVDLHLAAMRAGRARYHRDHPMETAMAQAVVAERRAGR